MPTGIASKLIPPGLAWKPQGRLGGKDLWGGLDHTAPLSLGEQTLKGQELPWCYHATAVPARHSWKAFRVHVLLPRGARRGLQSGYEGSGQTLPHPQNAAPLSPAGPIPPPAAAHPQIQLGAVQPEAAQPHGQIVDAERAVAIHVELLEQGAETPVLLGGLAQRPPTGPRTPPAAAAAATAAAAALHRRSLRGPAWAENAAHHRGGERAPRARHDRAGTNHPSRPRHRQMAPLPPSRHEPSLPRDASSQPITAGGRPGPRPAAPHGEGGP